MRIPNPLARKGEEEAVSYLRKLGYKIIDRNFRARNTEIDIVAIHDNTLVFIEVKTRTTNKFGTPLEQIAYFKLKSLIKAAEHYKLTHKNLPDLMRIDAISVQLDYKGIKVEHAQNISGF